MIEYASVLCTSKTLHCSSLPPNLLLGFKVGTIHGTQRPGNCHLYQPIPPHQAGPSPGPAQPKFPTPTKANQISFPENNHGYHHFR